MKAVNYCLALQTYGLCLVTLDVIYLITGISHVISGWHWPVAFEIW